MSANIYSPTPHSRYWTCNHVGVGGGGSYSCSDPICNETRVCTDTYWTRQKKQDTKHCACPTDTRTVELYEGRLAWIQRFDGIESESGSGSGSDDASIAGENMYTRADGVGEWGGECTCPNGQTYEVGDNIDGCGSLACYGGVVSKACSRGGIKDTSAGFQVHCAPSDLSSGFESGSGSHEDGSSPGSGLSAFVRGKQQWPIHHTSTLGVADLNWRNIRWDPLRNVALSVVEPFVFDGIFSTLSLPRNITGKVAVIDPGASSSDGARYGGLARRAQEAGAVAILFVHSDFDVALRMGRSGRYSDGQCYDPASCIDGNVVTIPVFLIEPAEGLVLVNAAKKDTSLLVDLERVVVQRKSCCFFYVARLSIY